MKLKLRRLHPSNSFRLGKHSITRTYQDFKLSKEELKELEGKGPKHWIISEAEEKPAVKTKSKIKKESK